MRFASPYAFLLLGLLPVIVWLALRRRSTGAVTFSSLRSLRQLAATLRLRARRLLFVLRLACLGLLIVALARPQSAASERRIASEGIAIEIVVDRSGSMKTEMDFAGERLTRLDVVKRVLAEFVLGNDDSLPGRGNDMIGLVSFARYADTICPLVRAHSAVVAFARSIPIVTVRAEDGTAIGDALGLAAARLKRAEEELRRNEGEAVEGAFQIKSKVIILLTDGANNAGELSPREAAELARDWGIRIYAIGIGGGEAFTTVTTPLGTMKVPTGADMDRTMLEEVATLSGGKAFMAGDGEALREIYEEIEALEKSEIESLEYVQYDEAFMPYALAAALLLLLEILLINTWLRRVP